MDRRCQEPGCTQRVRALPWCPAHRPASWAPPRRRTPSAAERASRRAELAGYCLCCYRGLRRHARAAGLTLVQALTQDRRLARRLAWR